MTRQGTKSDGKMINMLVASHNQKSIENTLDLAQKRQIDPNEKGIYFGQLLGMAVNLTFILGSNGWPAYKYVPYGPIDEVIPYLIRRAQENSDVTGGAGKEMKMLRTELVRRIFS